MPPGDAPARLWSGLWPGAASCYSGTGLRGIAALAASQPFPPRVMQVIVRKTVTVPSGSTMNDGDPVTPIRRG